MIDNDFRTRYWRVDSPRPDDVRDEYQRDKARIIHSSAFRRLQAKTQVMGVGEGDFHRTRLTHSIEAAQIGEGLLNSLKQRYASKEEVIEWLPPVDLLVAACLAHDLGHPPFGHGGEKALHTNMVSHGGFEGNGQTLRIVSRLEKYSNRQGMNPTRRIVLALLKYPAPYSEFNQKNFRDQPPKCYFDTEKEIVEWTLDVPFSSSDKQKYISVDETTGKPDYRALDCSLMEMADDIAYGVHDLEDIAARNMVHRDDVIHALKPIFDEYSLGIGEGDKAVTLEDFEDSLFGESFKRKEFIGKLVNVFITSARMYEHDEICHPLLRHHARFEKPIEELLKGLKGITYNLVIQRAEVKQLELRGRRIVDSLFKEIIKCPEELIPRSTWESFDPDDSKERKVCDYIAGMTDNYAEKIYRRLFIPGEGSSHDEL